MSLPRVAIVGPGLLGGSIALALRARRAASVAIWARRPEAVEELKAIAIADYSATNLGRVVRDVASASGKGDWTGNLAWKS